MSQDPTNTEEDTAAAAKLEAAKRAALIEELDTKIAAELAKLGSLRGGTPQQRNYLLESLRALGVVAQDFDSPVMSEGALDAVFNLVQFNMEAFRLCGSPIPIALITVEEVAPSPIIIPGTLPQTTTRLDVKVSSPATAVLGYVHSHQKAGKLIDSSQIQGSAEGAIILANGMFDAANTIRKQAQEVLDHRAVLPPPEPPQG